MHLLCQSSKKSQGTSKAHEFRAFDKCSCVQYMPNVHDVYKLTSTIEVGFTKLLKKTYKTACLPCCLNRPNPATSVASCPRCRRLPVIETVRKLPKKWHGHLAREDFQRISRPGGPHGFFTGRYDVIPLVKTMNAVSRFSSSSLKVRSLKLAAKR